MKFGEAFVIPGRGRRFRKPPIPFHWVRRGRVDSRSMGVEMENSTNEILAMASAEPRVPARIPCL
ncbi:hypothetical protein, partial [Acinetobacter baumannii]|uniref:hypothetical protein n=1 Tax=Acinetobacter baumannii TaxID=470 RepID=UPI0037D36385